MAKVEVPELTQALATVTNASIEVMKDVKKLVKVTSFAIGNMTAAVSRSLRTMEATVKEATAIIRPVVNMLGTVNRTVIDWTPTVRIVMFSLAFMLTAIGIFALVMCCVKISLAYQKMQKYRWDMRNASPTYIRSDCVHCEAQCLIDAKGA